MEGQSHADVGAFAHHRTYDRRSALRDDDYPMSFPREELGRAPWYMHPKWAAFGALLSLASTVAVLVGALVISQGYRYATPNDRLAATSDSVHTNSRRLTAIETRVVPIVEGLGRLQCIQNPQDANRAGLKCDRLLNGDGVLSGTARVTPPDGSSVLAVVRIP